MPATKTAKSPGWGAKPKKQAADTFVSGDFGPLNVRLPRPLIAEAKAYCAREGVTMQAFVESLLLQGLK
jgi:predicted DNA binding CopG/RHH family protein